MKRGAPAMPALLAVGLAASGCAHHSVSLNTPVSLPTLPPGGAFRDGLLYAAVKARLAGADIDAATHVSVAVRNGTVTLRGAVKNAAERDRFAKLAGSLHGVRSVDDELHVGRVESLVDSVHDASLVAAVTSALTEQTGINVTGISVHADRGRITLSGSAPTPAIRSTLVAAAQHTPGVRNVVDKITVKE